MKTWIAVGIVFVLIVAGVAIYLKSKNKEANTTVEAPKSKEEIYFDFIKGLPSLLAEVKPKASPKGMGAEVPE